MGITDNKRLDHRAEPSNKVRTDESQMRYKVNVLSKGRDGRIIDNDQQIKTSLPVNEVQQQGVAVHRPQPTRAKINPTSWDSAGR